MASDLKGTRILVTGGCGFIGSHIVGSLVDAGAEVRVYDNLSSGSLDYIEPWRDRVDFVEADILDRDALCAAARGCETVSHQAAQLEITTCIDDPLFDLRVNTVGTLNALAAAKEAGVRRVVVASSACVYGEARTRPVREDHPTEPNWEYGVSKLAAEKYSTIFADETGIAVPNLRYGITYGEREWYGRVLTVFLKRAMAGRPPVVFGDGAQIRDFVYVGDVVELHNRCITAELTGAPAFNASTGIGTNVAQLATLVSEITGVGDQPIFEDVAEGEYSSEVDGRVRLPRELQVMHLANDRARDELGWEPKVALPEGIAREWRWLQDNEHRWTTFGV